MRKKNGKCNVQTLLECFRFNYVEINKSWWWYNVYLMGLFILQVKHIHQILSPNRMHSNQDSK